MTTTTQDFEALAALCEAATGPSSMLDRDIAVACGVPIEDERGTIIPPYYTASLDAAMTLVPEGCWLSLNIMDDLPIASLGLPGTETVADGRAATPALALCAASLRARA